MKRTLVEILAGMAVLVLLSWLVLAAGVLDAIENYALIQMLLSGASDLWARISWWCATPKFILVGLGLLFALAGYVASLFAASTRTGSP